MPSDQNSKDDRVLTEHLEDQFVAWFIGVMAFVYLVEYLHENHLEIMVLELDLQVDKQEFLDHLVALRVLETHLEPFRHRQTFLYILPMNICSL